MISETINRILNEDYIELDLPLPERNDNEAWKNLVEQYFPECTLLVGTNDYYTTFSKAYKQIFIDGLHSEFMIKNRSIAVRSDSRIVYHVVSMHGQELEWAVLALQNNKEIACEAVDNNCNALQFAADRRDDPDVVHRALTNKRGYALEHASPRLQDDETTVALAANEYGLGMKHATPRWQNDLKMSLRAMRSGFFSEVHFSSDVKNNPVYKEVKEITDYKERNFFISHSLGERTFFKSARNTGKNVEEAEKIETLGL